MRRARLAAACVLALACAAGTAHAQDWRWSDLPKERKLLYTNLGIVAFITAYGVAQWDYFQSSPQAKSEGWFGRATGEGGADKLGHAYTGHLLANVLAARYRAWGYEPDRAALYGALSSFGVQTFMEIGDSFSGQYGFAYEDFVANGVGAAFGYLYYTHPTLSERLDFRMEYEPTFEDADIFTDYGHHKYLLALKLSGFEATRRTPLRFVELQAGYYTRGYEDVTVLNNRRTFYVGVGLNVSEVIAALGFPRFAKFFHYYQTPYTYLDARHRFDD